MSAAALRLLEDNSDLHFTVLRQEAVGALQAERGGTFVDATAGAGGHSEALLEANAVNRVIAFDRDASAVDACRARLGRFGARARVVHLDFAGIGAWLGQQGIAPVDGLVADLGLSSPQLERPERGMSFRLEGPIDMRMDTSRGETARELIEGCTESELADLVYLLGGERRSRRVARCVKQALAADELDSTLQLRKAIVRAVGPQRVGGIDPATRTFQALRIAVNRELEQLENLLGGLSDCVRGGGAIAIIAFHSLEDRRVKQALADEDRFERLWKRPLLPTAAEVEANPRSRSAKLRAAKLRPKGSVSLLSAVSPDRRHGNDA